MSWMEMLYETYELGMSLDLSEVKKPMPIGHTVQNAHINIVIDGKGNFKRAKILEKTQIRLPATEDSASRSSGEAPHPLADKLQYVAKDYSQWGGIKNCYYSSYHSLLHQWINSLQVHPSAEAVYLYISRGSVLSDLITQKIIYVDSANILLTSWESQEGVEPPLLFKVLPKQKGKLDQGNALVCWTVEDRSISCPNTWEDATLQKSWSTFVLNNANTKGLCYLSGKQEILALKHPAKIRHSGDKAKLISANDSSGFTYRGRFLKSSQAVSVSSIISQKAHNALGWLIDRQGFRNGDQVFIAWAVCGKDIPQPFEETVNFDFDDFDMNEQFTEVFSHTIIRDHTVDIGQGFARALNRHMTGYRSLLNVTDSIVIMGLDSATPGRMGIIYYREFLAEEYIERISKWYSDFSWFQRVKKEIPQKKGKSKEKITWPISTPSPWSILKAVYGDIVKSNEKLKNNLYERLMPCILDNQNIPVDILMRSIKRASNRNGIEKWEWEIALGVACALYKGYYKRHTDHNKRRNYIMALDLTNQSRDYLYGRLLAVAERIEEIALFAASVNRATTVARLMQRFADRPYSTWLIIYKQIQPYMQQLQVSRTGFLINRKTELDTIMDLFSGDDFINDKALSGEFLLGFHCQRLALRNNKDSNNEGEK